MSRHCSSPADACCSLAATGGAGDRRQPVLPHLPVFTLAARLVPGWLQ